MVTGGNGAMAKALFGKIDGGFFLSRGALDVTDEKAVARVFREMEPKAVLHLAAVTDHQCKDMDALIRTNVLGTQYVAKYAEELCAKLIYTSTHYVYPGRTGAYRETDMLDPIGLYALTKLSGEEAIRAVSTSKLIIRGSWYTKEKLALWSKGTLADAFTNRESVEDAAEKIALMVNEGLTGTINIGGKRRSFVKILKDEGYEVNPIKRNELALPYSFPADSSVDTSKYDAFASLQAA